jgi:tetrahydromethanopterin S-methyltransferase subunit A
MPGHIIEDMLDSEDAEKLKKQIEQQIEKTQESPKTPEQQECEHKAKLLLEEQGKNAEDKKLLEHTIKDIQTYEKTLQDIEKIKDSETGQSVIDEIV